MNTCSNTTDAAPALTIDGLRKAIETLKEPPPVPLSLLRVHESMARVTCEVLGVEYEPGKAVYVVASDLHLHIIRPNERLPLW